MCIFTFKFVSYPAWYHQMGGVNGLYLTSPPQCGQDVLTALFGSLCLHLYLQSTVLLWTPIGSVWWRPGLVRQGRRGGRRWGPLRGPHCPGCYGNSKEPSGCCDCGRLAGRRSTSGDGFLGSCCQPVWSGDIWTGSHTYWYVNWMTSVKRRCDVIFILWNTHFFFIFVLLMFCFDGFMFFHYN